MRSKKVDAKCLFITTSPRSPLKMIPEISLLDENLHGQIWNKDTQTHFYNLLRDNEFFEGSVSSDPAFSARDRINRAPKILGFVSLPRIGLTQAGKDFVEMNDKSEVLLRQLLKFQIPSPYHPLGDNAAKFWVKPYLEILRLIYTLGELTFDELQIFGLKLVDYRQFNSIVEKIKAFRIEKNKHKGRYKEFKERTLLSEVKETYRDELSEGKTKTRESADDSKKKFLTTKIGNLRDYSDAAVRYLRATGLINVTAIGRTLSIVVERKKDVEFILKNVNRNPCFVNDIEKYEDYLWNSSVPQLLTDNKNDILNKLKTDFKIIESESKSINSLKNILNKKIEERKEEKLKEQIYDLKKYQMYEDIEDQFDKMKSLYDPSLFFEWNTWRAMTMLDGGTIKPNLLFDDAGNPMCTAAGKMADIECEYEDFDLNVEVSLSSGALQFKMEGEPIPRHIGLKKEKTHKETFGFFIAPTINEATVAHFYSLYSSNIQMYGGKCCIIPMTLSVFRGMLKKAYNSKTKPCSEDIKILFEKSKKYVKECVVNDLTEKDWYLKITEDLDNWLST